MTESASTVYRAFIDALNARDLQAAVEHVDTDAYRETCVGFTRGEVGWIEAVAELTRVWEGLPDLHVELAVVAEQPRPGGDTTVLAHGTATGTATGRLYGAPATKKRYRASFFDRVTVRDGRIVWRVQQADVLGQMRQLYGRVLGTLGIGALLRRL